MIQVPSNGCWHSNSCILFFAGGLISLSSINDKLITGANQIQLCSCSSIFHSFCYLPNFLAKADSGSFASSWLRFLLYLLYYIFTQKWTLILVVRV